MKLFRDYLRLNHLSGKQKKFEQIIREPQEQDVLVAQFPLLSLSEPRVEPNSTIGYPSTKSDPQRLVSDISDVVEQFVLSRGELSYRESLSRLMDKYDIPQTPATAASFDYFDQELNSATALQMLLEKLQWRLDLYGDELEQFELSIWNQEFSLEKKAQMLTRLSAILDKRNNGLDIYLCSLLERKAHLDAIDAIVTTRLYGECQKFLTSYRDVILPYKREVDAMLQAKALDPKNLPSRRKVYKIMTHSFLEFDRFRRLKHYIASVFKTEYESYVSFLREVDSLYEDIIQLQPEARKFEFK